MFGGLEYNRSPKSYTEEVSFHLHSSYEVTKPYGYRTTSSSQKNLLCVYIFFKILLTFLSQENFDKCLFTLD